MDEIFVSTRLLSLVRETLSLREEAEAVVDLTEVVQDSAVAEEVCSEKEALKDTSYLDMDSKLYGRVLTS